MAVSFSNMFFAQAPWTDEDIVTSRLDKVRLNIVLLFSYLKKKKQLFCSTFYACIHIDNKESIQETRRAC